MIPKIIHYCWFGRKQLPEHAKKCISSWKIFFPEYEIKEWNETNFNINKIPYISEAYNEMKFAFVSDYARFDILYQYGGIYFDTDVEVIKSFDTIIKNGGFMGFEDINKINSGLGMGCCNGLDIILQILDYYKSIHFINKDGSYNLHTVVEYVTNILKMNGLKYNNSLQCFNGITIYPIEYFAPKSPVTGELNITKNTHSIHYYDGSWVPENEKTYYAIKRKLCKVFGSKLGMIISFPIFIIININNHGIKNGIKQVQNKINKTF